ncbi:Alpha-aminoadipate reductase [Fusarium sp. LHS14.1]|nr:Alpha-aminoadipate reductase [Fusarium sp. LHS14.1]
MSCPCSSSGVKLQDMSAVDEEVKVKEVSDVALKTIGSLLWVEADKANEKDKPWRRYYKEPRDRVIPNRRPWSVSPLGNCACLWSYRLSGQDLWFPDRAQRNRCQPGRQPLVRDVKTLARRDRNEEPTLVSYVVPEILEWKRWLEAQNHEDIEDEGVEMGPTVVYLKRFRRTQAESSTLIPGLNAKAIRPESDYFDCGGHSLLAQKLPLSIRKSLGADITIGVLYANPSLRGLGSQVDRLRSSWAAIVDKAVDTAYAESFDELINTLDNNWKHATETADAVVYNAVYVHWIARYEQMMRLNVLSTIDAMKLCNEGKPKLFSFVSSTSTLDTGHYVNSSHEQTPTRRGAVLKADDMQGSRVGLGTVYGQTKWVSEQLVQEADKHGLRGAVVRPGYILGSRENGVLNTDDFLIRLCKGRVQLGVRSLIINSVNTVPMDHVARVVIASALKPRPGVNVVHVTAHPRIRINEFLSALEYYGYNVPEVDYEEWKTQLEEFVSAGSTKKDQEQSALMPLFHMATSNLPSTTRAPELDDRNAVTVLKADADRWTGVDDSAGEGITREDIGRYLRFLAEIKFMPLPTRSRRELPPIAAEIAQAQAQWRVGGGGGAA